jgi:hypothetical protein
MLVWPIFWKSSKFRIIVMIPIVGGPSAAAPSARRRRRGRPNIDAVQHLCNRGLSGLRLKNPSLTGRNDVAVQNEGSEGLLSDAQICHI